MVAVSLRPCPTPGCPTLTRGGRCTTCARHHDAGRGRRQARGYDATHDRERRRWTAILARQPVPCARGCGALIHTGDQWHLDHTDDRTGYLGPSCAHCNLSAAGKAAH